MSANNSHSLGEQVRSGAKGIHGIGEAIRGTVLSETDKAFDTHDAANPTKHERVANKGFNQMKNADDVVGHNHGVTTAGASAAAGTANTAPTTSAGAHSTAPGNIGSTGATDVHGPTGVQEQPRVNQRF